MKTLGYSLMVLGMLLAFGGVVAVFSFDQPSEVFSFIWWMIIGGWCLVFAGLGIDMMQLLKVAKHVPTRVFQRQVNRAQGVEREIAGL